MPCNNEIINDILTKISTEELISELTTRDDVKELIYTYDDYVIISGCNDKCKLSYETKGPLRILILEMP